MSKPMTDARAQRLAKDALDEYEMAYNHASAVIRARYPKRQDIIDAITHGHWGLRTLMQLATPANEDETPYLVSLPDPKPPDPRGG